MKFILLLSVFTSMIISCTPNNKESQKIKFDSTFIDTTDFKYFGLEKFDIQDWYDGKIELKTLSKLEAKKYYQYRLRPNTADTSNYKFYSVQKNQRNLKIITIIDGATGKFPDLRLLIYNHKDSLIGFYPIAGIGKDTDYNFKYKVTSERINDTIYISKRVSEHSQKIEFGKAIKDSIITKFTVGLGFMEGAEILEKRVFTKIKN